MTPQTTTPAAGNALAVPVSEIFESLRYTEDIELLLPFCKSLAYTDPEEFRINGGDVEHDTGKRFLAAEDLKLLADIIEASTDADDLRRRIHTASANADRVLEANRAAFYRESKQLRAKAYALISALDCHSENTLILRVDEKFGTAQSESNKRLEHLIKSQWTKFKLDDDRSPAIISLMEQPPNEYLGRLAKICQSTNALGCFPLRKRKTKKELDNDLKDYQLPDSPYLFSCASYGYPAGVLEDETKENPVRLAVPVTPSLAAVVARERAGENICNEPGTLPLATALQLDYEVPETDDYVRRSRINVTGHSGQVYGGVTLSNDLNEDLQDLAAMGLRAQIARELSAFARAGLYKKYDRKILIAALLAYFSRYLMYLKEPVLAEHIGVERNPIMGHVNIDVELQFEKSVKGYVFSIRSKSQQSFGSTPSPSKASN